MGCKRKALSPVPTHSADDTRKIKWKDTHVIISSDDEDDQDSSSLEENEWLINCILDENESQYLIDWEGPWSPSWEPKEHANDAAIQAWKEKQRHRTPSSPLEPGDPDESASQLFVRQSSPCSESALFVPPSSQSQKIDQPFNESLRSSRITTPQITPGNLTSETPRAGDRPSSSSNSPSDLGYIFQHTTKNPIPPEYRLPGELEDPFITAQKPTTPFGRSSLTQYRENQTQISPLQSGIRGNAQANKSAAASPTKKLPNTQSRQEVAHEIAETPPETLGVLHSQASELISQSTSSGSQFSLKSLSLLSKADSSVSQLYLADRSTPAQRFGSIPESVAVGRAYISEGLCVGAMSESTSAAPNNHISSPPQTPKDQNELKRSQLFTETMEKFNDFEGLTPREKIKSGYAQLQARAASMAPPNEPSATPSSVGDIEAAAPEPLPETAAPLSVRVDRDATHPAAHPEPVLPEGQIEETSHEGVQTIQPSALTVGHTQEMSPGSVHLGPAEFSVPLPMDSRVKDDYDRVLENEAQSIDTFLIQSKSLSDETTEPENSLLAPKVREVLAHLSNVATHPDLNIADHIKESDSDFAKEAAWAEYSSAKFLFLSYLLEFVSSRDMHFVVMVHGDNAQKVVERYLMGKGLVYTRPREEMGNGTNLEVSMVKGPLSIGIQLTQSDGIFETYKTPSAIIALDTTFNAKAPPVEHMRTTFARHGTLLPVIRLIISNSSEHVELCFLSLPEIQRLRTTIQYTIRLRDMVGDLQDDALGVREDVEEIIAYLSSDNFHTSWPLAPIEPIQIVSPEELDAIHFGNETQASADSAPVPERSPQKRQFTEDDQEQISKRIRMDMSQEPTQFTESSKFPSQTLDSDLQALEKHLVQMRTTHATELEKLQKALLETQTRLQEREKILGTLQHRYESRTKDLHKIRQERDRLAESKTTSEQRVEKQKDEISKLKDERTQLRHDLEKAREELKAGGGSVAELETLREEIRRLTKENASLERKAEYEGRQAEYTREQYQTASNVAAQSGNEIRQLREENEALNRKVAGDATRLRELNMQSNDARHLSRIAELEATLSSRDDMLRRKEDELREIRKNRPSTRSTSTQPRSPKLNPGNSRPTSPGFGNNGSNFPGRGSALRFSSEMSL